MWTCLSIRPKECKKVDDLLSTRETDCLEYSTWFDLKLRTVLYQPGKVKKYPVNSQ